jgi:hypothetical protein
VKTFVMFPVGQQPGTPFLLTRVGSGSGHGGRNYHGVRARGSLRQPDPCKHFYAERETRRRYEDVAGYRRCRWPGMSNSKAMFAGGRDANQPGA